MKMPVRAGDSLLGPTASRRLSSMCAKVWSSRGRRPPSLQSSLRPWLPGWHTAARDSKKKRVRSDGERRAPIGQRKRIRPGNAEQEAVEAGGGESMMEAKCGSRKIGGPALKAPMVSAANQQKGQTKKKSTSFSPQRLLSPLNPLPVTSSPFRSFELSFPG